MASGIRVVVHVITRAQRLRREQDQSDIFSEAVIAGVAMLPIFVRLLLGTLVILVWAVMTTPPFSVPKWIRLQGRDEWTRMHNNDHIGETMPVPASRAVLLDAIDVTFTRLTADLDQVPPSMVRDATMDGHVKGTRMSPADLVAYLIGWNTQVLVWCRRREDGLPDEFPASDLGWNELGALAQRFYCEHAEESWESLRLQLDTAQRNVVELVERLDDEQLYGAPWYGKWTLGRMISLNTSSPYANARKRIRAWLRERDRAGTALG